VFFLHLSWTHFLPIFKKDEFCAINAFAMQDFPTHGSKKVGRKRNGWSAYVKRAGTDIYRKVVRQEAAPQKSIHRGRKDSEAGTTEQTTAMQRYRQSSEEEQFW
jgi:hypothetical protein